MLRTSGQLIVVLLVALGCGAEPKQEPPDGRVLLIGIDGASWTILGPLLEAGRMPHLASLAREGVAGTIRSEAPIDSPRIWNTIVTGKTPAKHGIAHFAHQEEGEMRLFLSSERRVHALWNIVSDAGRRVGVVNFWNTYPPEVVDGVMVSDHLLARNIESRRRLTKAREVPAGPVVHPQSWSERITTLLDHPEPLTRFANPLRDNPDLPRYLVLVGEDMPRRFDEDGALTRIALEIDQSVKPDLLMVLLTGIDRTSHFLWGATIEDQTFYEEPLRVSERERAGGKRALDTYYEYTDALIGKLLEGYGPDDLVIVLSDHGFEPGRGMGLLTGIHEGEAAIDGIFFARGRGIEPGAEVGPLSIRDVTPTILAWLGLPVGDDMDGRPGDFLGAPAPARVATHDVGEIERLELRPSGAEDELVEQLKRLGYLE
jgi:hypothetical protein